MTGRDGDAGAGSARVLAAGFDAIVNERANRMRWPRGPRRYDLAILVGAGPAAAAALHAATWTASGVETRRRAGRGRQHRASYGGGMRICPDADPTDGLLDVVVGGADRPR